MNILFLTNTYLPHVGGVARSVVTFAEEFRRLGHRVLIVAPTFPDAPDYETDVLRVPAIEHFRNTDFSWPLPVPDAIWQAILDFRPAVVHAHHPFLLGHTALRVAVECCVPIVYTSHTQYEKYVHYVTSDNEFVRRLIIEAVTGFANLCDAVVAPSESMAELLRSRGVTAPLEAIPTGVDVGWFARGDGFRFRREIGLPADAFVVGHVGRLAPEKNLEFLAAATGEFLLENRRAWFVLVGTGPSQEPMLATFERLGVRDRVLTEGVLRGDRLREAYAAFDVFAFTSLSETQGIVLVEAMATGAPVVAIDAPGVREVVRDGVNGRLLPDSHEAAFREALAWVANRSAKDREQLQRAAHQTAREFSRERCAKRMLALYSSLRRRVRPNDDDDFAVWTRSVRRLQEEWQIWSSVAHAIGDAMVQTCLNWKL